MRAWLLFRTSAGALNILGGLNHHLFQEPFKSFEERKKKIEQGVTIAADGSCLPEAQSA
jgi:hypothetical protein